MFCSTVIPKQSWGLIVSPNVCFNLEKQPEAVLGPGLQCWYRKFNLLLPILFFPWQSQTFTHPELILVSIWGRGETQYPVFFSTRASGGCPFLFRGVNPYCSRAVAIQSRPPFIHYMIPVYFYTFYISLILSVPSVKLELFLILHSSSFWTNSLPSPQIQTTWMFFFRQIVKYTPVFYWCGSFFCPGKVPVTLQFWE